jgi:hypothetical protein
MRSKGLVYQGENPCERAASLFDTPLGWEPTRENCVACRWQGGMRPLSWRPCGQIKHSASTSNPHLILMFQDGDEFGADEFWSPGALWAVLAESPGFEFYVQGVRLEWRQDSA